MTSNAALTRRKSAIMNTTPSRCIAFAALSCALVVAGSPVLGQSKAASPATGVPKSTTPPSPADAANKFKPSYTGKPVSPKAGFGNAQGRVLFDEKPVPGVRVRLCQEIQALGGGCKGKIFDSKTDAEGNYTIDNVKPGEYALAVSVFNTNKFIYITEGFLKSAMRVVVEGKTLNFPVVNLFKDDLKIISPKNKETMKSATPQLKWQSYPNAASYEIVLGGAGGTTYSSERLKTSSPQIEPRTPLFNGTYGWQVTAFNAKGIKLAETSNFPEFKVAGQADPPAPVKLIAPLEKGGPMSGSGLKFSWKAQPQAQNYNLLINRPTNKDKQHFSKSVKVTALSYDLDTPLEAGYYTWHVLAMSGDKVISRSEPGHFRVK